MLWIWIGDVGHILPSPTKKAAEDAAKLLSEQEVAGDGVALGGRCRLGRGTR